MKQSKLFTKTRKEAPKDEISKNAQLLTKAGYIYKEMAGVYTFLPLGMRVIENIKQIIREELDAVGCQEMLMTTLQAKDHWEKTDRWRSDLDDGIWFKTKMNNGVELGLAFTHEEALTNIMRNYIFSHKDLPVYAYQFQTKFRNELRAKSGIMRGREFIMKDLYDFSRSQEDHEQFYEKMKGVYMQIFTRLGIGDKTYLTISNGGTFSKYSYEFQTLCEAGEDILVLDRNEGIAINKDDYNDEVLKDFNIDPKNYNFEEVGSVEVGDIYTLGQKYSRALGLTYKDENGDEKPVFMGSYGIGVPRIMGTIVEVLSDEKGIIWPQAVAPYAAHLLSIKQDEKAQKLYEAMKARGIEVLFDERDVSAGEKFADADLIGLPVRVVVSQKTLDANGYEVKRRSEDSTKIYSQEALLDHLQNKK